MLYPYKRGGLFCLLFVPHFLALLPLLSAETGTLPVLNTADGIHAVSEELPKVCHDLQYVQRTVIFTVVACLDSSKELVYLGNFEVGCFLVHDLARLTCLRLIHAGGITGIVEVGDVGFQQEHRAFRSVVGQCQVLQGRVGGGHALGEGLQSQRLATF